MSSIAVGNALETKIYNLFQTEIAADRLWAKKDNCRLFLKKGYYSRDRKGKIIFDVSIEIYLPGSTDYSMLALVECKNQTRPVSVDEAEEFFAKVQQVAPANAKAVIAATASFQKGTMEYAKSKGIGLLRYFDNSDFRWELRRSPSACAGATDANAAYLVEEGLSRPDFKSPTFDLYMQSPSRLTNSLWDFIEDLVLESSLTPAQACAIANPRSRHLSQIPFLEKDELEERATEALLAIGYREGKVSLEALCEREKESCDLNVIRGVVPPQTDSPGPVLGCITFDPLEIKIYAPAVPKPERERFTLAHELAHHLLKHGQYMVRESCCEEDLLPDDQRMCHSAEIARLEFQANFFAASLLMPRTSFAADLRRIVKTLNILDRGKGPLYVDNQICNQQNYSIVTSKLMQIYGVSRTATAIRLKELGLLQDGRTPVRLGSVSSALVRLCDADHLDDDPPFDEHP